jgi:ParB family chromosome partitioning protein
LEDSLRRSGVLSPPWVLPIKGGKEYIIIDGFKRLDLLHETGVQQVECIAFPEDSDPLELMLRRIEGKLFGPPLNVAEMAQVISKVSEILPSQEAVAAFFHTCGIPARVGALTKWRRLASESDAFLEAVATEEISERAALELTGWEEEAKSAAVVLLRELRCSTSIQMEILERISEIAFRMNSGRSAIILSSDIQEILRHPDWDRRRKTQALRELLYRRRYPRLRAREERFELEVTAAGLPKSAHLAPPAAFEGEQWRLQLTFSNPDALQALLDQMRSFAHSPQLKAIMRPDS